VKEAPWSHIFSLGANLTNGLIYCLFIVSAAQAESSLNKNQIIFSSEHETIQFEIELAETDQQRQVGLMHRTWLHPQAGMLFTYDDGMKLRHFWMKNTPTPLDIIFFDHTGTVVHIIENTIPYSEEVLPSTKPAVAALEINAGLSEKLGIVVGMKAQHPFFK